ncbi:BTAD domain-containing putative transcriptional regulator [Nocardia sp. 348MFTsu5.1]|uniref:BTAD domain-containing putative transcriptional regulator n=1 Tax=Nocardia sp. 348MFTsu5.1 TaxID=1172185 RepID=UPI000373A7BC|nr:BTAD domain-containing putative transcriptional regulator [Nocardia sp. 348MFTsu5.1]
MPPAAGVPIIGLLGPVSIADENGRMRPVPGIRARRLLAVLALTPGSQRSQSALIDGVWGDDLPRSPQSALHTQISRLRPLLPEGAIEAGPAGYRLTLPAVAVDVFTAQSLLADGSAQSLEAAARLWRGAPGDDLGDDDLARDVRQAADRVQVELDERRSQKALDDGDFETARALAQRRADADPLDESAHATLMRALSALGRSAEALAVFARLRRTLSTELGADPGPEVAALHEQLLQPTPVERPREVGRVMSVGLSAEPNELLGREADISRICSLLRTSRVVTIQGPGGAGKTRVANLIGHLIADDGVRVFFVELASVRGEDDVVAAVAATLGVGESDVGLGGRPRLAFSDLQTRLADALTSETLVIFDNCEHVVDACARVASELIGMSENVRILTTSRSPLRVNAEVIHQLPPLSIDEYGSAATDLFTARARAIRPDVTIDNTEVADLCRALDGLPLAIELAAARVRTMSVAEISQRLSQRFALLRTGDRSSPVRHRTLHAVIEWSWELLDEPARIALRRLCRFPGGFSRAAARDVVGVTDLELDDDLDALVDQSLLQVFEHGGVRYRMLETVREFGEEQLIASGEGPQVNSSIARWARTFAGDARQPFENGEQPAVLAAVSAEVDNLVWVLRRCMEPDVAARPADWEQTIVACFPVIAGFWAVRGLHGEVMAWAPRVVAVLPYLDQAAADGLADTEREYRQAVYLIAGGHLLMARSHRLVAIARWQLRRLFRADLADQYQFDFISSIMLAHHKFGALRRMVIGARCTDSRVRMIAALLTANTRENMSDRRGAVQAADIALGIAESHNDSWIAASVLMQIGSFHGQTAQYEMAIESYRRAMGLLEMIGSDQDVRQTRGYIVAALVGMGRIEEARKEFAVFAEGWVPADPDPRAHPEIAAAILVGAAELEWQDDNADEAADLFERSVRLLLSEHPSPAQDPFVGMVISTGVCGMALAGRTAVSGRYLSNVGSIAAAMFSRGGLADLPQLGAMAMAFGVALSGRDPGSVSGARLLLLAERIGCRLDYTTLVVVRERSQEIAAVPDAQWQELSAEIDKMSRRQAVQDILSIMENSVAAV